MWTTGVKELHEALQVSDGGLNGLLRILKDFYAAPRHLVVCGKRLIPPSSVLVRAKCWVTRAFGSELKLLRSLATMEIDIV